MIDIHTHILSSLDDGPDSLPQALKIVSQAYKHGITAIFATPHSMDGVYQSMPREIINKCNLLTKVIEENRIPVKVLPGSEIRLTHDTVSLYDEDKLMTFNNMGKYILLELPPMFIVDGVIHTIRQLADRGLTTIIAHPERNASIIKNLNIISKLIYEGVMMQITATSFMGGFGKRIMKICEKMIDKDAVTFIGSDIHPGRRFMMLEAYQKTQSIAGEKVAEKIFMKNPEDIILPACNRNEFCEIK